MTWEPPLGGEALPRLVVEVDGDQLTVWYDITEVGIVFRAVEGADLTTTHLRANFGALRQQLQTILQNDPDRLLGPALLGRIIEEQGGTATADELSYMRAARQAARDSVAILRNTRPTPGRGRANHDFYRAIALSYIAALKEHGPRGVIKAIADEMGMSDERDKVAVWVRRARETGWLERRTNRDETGAHQWRGKAYGGPGPRLLRWLEEHPQSDSEEEA